MGFFRADPGKLTIEEHNAHLMEHSLSQADDPVLRQAMTECMRGHPFADYYDIASDLRRHLGGITFEERHLYFLTGAIRIMRQNADYQLAELRPMMLKAIECHAADPDRWREIWLTIAHAPSFYEAELTFGHSLPAEYVGALT